MATTKTDETKSADTKTDTKTDPKTETVDFAAEFAKVNERLEALEAQVKELSKSPPPASPVADNAGRIDNLEAGHQSFAERLRSLELKLKHFF